MSECRQKGIIEDQVVAIDSTPIDAYEEKQPRKHSKLTGNADWGCKKGSFGNTIIWFG